MKLVVRTVHLDQMRAHARSTYPEECIGILGGEYEDDERTIKTVTEVRQMNNSMKDSRHNRSLISPEEVFKVDREYRKRGLKMLGFYHSHPDHPCKPSQFDLEHALPNTSYVIVKIDKGEPVEITSWTLKEDRSAFDPESIQTQFDL